MDKLTRDVLIGLAGTAAGAGIGVAIGYGVWGARAPQITLPSRGVQPTGAPFPSKQRPQVTFRPGVVPTIPTKSVITAADEGLPTVQGATATAANDGGYRDAVNSIAWMFWRNMKAYNPGRVREICARLAALPDRGASGAALNEITGEFRMRRELSMALDGRGADLMEIAGWTDAFNGHHGGRDYYLALALKKMADGAMHRGLDMPWERVNWDTYGNAFAYATTAAFMRDLAAAIASVFVRECPGRL